MTGNRDMETDVLVIGGGGCGLVAAISAHDAGAEVAVLEKMDRVGGNTALSTGSVPGAGTRFQREAGIEDSPERMVDDLMRQSGPHDCLELTRTLAEQSADLVEWLADHVKARIGLITEYCHVGHSVPRLHAPRSRRGQDLLEDLMRAVEARQIPVAVGNPVDRLITDDNGAAAGVVVRDRAGRETRIDARKIILATNGFAANRTMLRRYCPEMAEMEYFGADGSTGEAILWGEELGAALANMGAYQGYAAVTYPQGALLSWTTMEKGGVLVNGCGRRFCNEIAGYSGLAREVMVQGQFAYAVFDERVRATTALEEEFNELVNYGGIKNGDSPAEMAAVFRLDAEALTETLERYNAAASGQVEDEFGRRDFGLAPLEWPPLFLCRVRAGLFHTQGGLRVDASARVLRPDGSVIPNLFAGGGTAAGISGREGGYGYASGNGLLTALGLGRIAGLTAAREIGGEA
ncbi:MAG: flavocytochrome c [Candidatus Methylomirabilales bacterium]